MGIENFTEKTGEYGIIPNELELCDEKLLGETLNTEINKLVIEKENEIKGFGEITLIPGEIVENYLNEIKREGKSALLLSRKIDELGILLFGNDFFNFKDEIERNGRNLLLAYYIKTICPEGYSGIVKSIARILHSMDNAMSAPNYKIQSIGEFVNLLVNFVKENGKDSVDYFEYCYPHNQSYLSENTVKLTGYGREYIEEKAAKMQKIEAETNGIIYNEAENLEDTRVEVEKQMKNLNNTLETKGFSVQFLETFIDEPEGINLFKFLKDNPQKLENLGGKVVNEIDLNVNKGINFGFHGILSMVRSRTDIDFPKLSNNPTEKEKMDRKEKWENIIREYETLLREYISMDFSIGNNGEKIEKPKEQTFNKIFYLRQLGDLTMDTFHIDEETLKSLTTNPISDYSYSEAEKGVENSNTMLLDIENYILQNPEEKILVCVDDHGGTDGSSSNGWSKEEWIRLANLSPNIKIWSIRCYFGTAFEKEMISKNKSSLSGFSNSSPTYAYVTSVINEANKMKLGYHEMEIYTRLHYPLSVSPLTENLQYINWNNGDLEVGKVGLANIDKHQNDLNSHEVLNS